MGSKEGDVTKDEEISAKGEVEAVEAAGKKQPEDEYHQTDTKIGLEELISLDDSTRNEEVENEAEIFELELGEVQEAENCKNQLEQESSGTLCEAIEVEEDNEQLQDMDLGDDDVFIKRQVSEEIVQLDGSMPSAQELNGVADAMTSSSGNVSIDKSPTRVKRARKVSTGEQPSVRLIYHGLTRESKRKLMALMQQWSEWQAKKQSTSKELTLETLEDGEATYYPALHVHTEESCTLSFWLDNQASEDAAKDEDSVPVYDREFTLGSSPFEDSLSIERVEKDDSRCFNCGSYSHALKECPKPRDNVAIGNARKQYNSKRNLSGGNRGQNRYYQRTPGKFDDLKPGVLGPETRECLGIGEDDPPPWLHRMRELGYPPGYLDVVEDEDQPSGIAIFVDGEVKEDYEEGELAEKAEAESAQRRMTVEFPGINAPIPENGDSWLWASNANHFSESGYGSRSNIHHSLSHPWEQRDRGPPGAEYGPMASSHAYSSPRYNPYDHSHGLPSPGFGRSPSDRGWRSSPAYDNSPADKPQSIHSYSSSRQLQRQTFERWNDGSYDASHDSPLHHSRDRYDGHHHRR